ncbi:FAD-binding and (Fe-S)-binding domain-containing protein [Pseudoalteromonas fenneropenaei]|uniref:FAD-binding and (Fe-S)-binding domain-containing protein n=1 Tax=Pseudoalteromonas fenneropenaei TaxID=1737459 RepID=A0ABV7CIW2_9GAMM
MIAQLSQQHTGTALLNQYIATIKKNGFSGEADTSYATRLVNATDNSVYQELPQAVIYPKTVKDIQVAMQTASSEPFLSLTFGPRGGGTGTNGQSLTPGIVVDLSKHMRDILEINVEERWVKVQAGVIKDQLNDFLKPYGFFFAPDLSTSNRATIGGMVNTDASGQGSLVYGKTSDHVLGLTTILVDGTELHTSRMETAKAEILAEQEGKVGEIYRTVLTTCRNKREQILAKFPRLNRFLTGYDLEHVFSDDLLTFDLGRVIAGSEGSLGIVTSAKLNITPIAPFKTLINIKYDSFDSALRNSPFLVAAKATSVETVDSKVLNLAREDIIWHSVSDLITDVPDKDMQGLNMVEFNGETPEEIADKVETLCHKLDELIANKQAGIIGYQRTSDKADILKVYAMRKKSVGLLGNVKGKQKPIAFAEDTAVPPENLADFIVEFRQLLDSKGLYYGMFGHVDAGVLHVRPALDMCDPEQEKLLREVSDQVVALTAKYGGLMWGEHGKGYRSEYGPQFFGEELFTELRRIKAVFDKNNRLNPGKICTPLDSNDKLVSVDGQKRAWFDKQIDIQVRDSFDNAMTCNGNGLCYNYDEQSPMCPSYKVTKDRRYSPKGRAGLMREWLRLQEEAGVKLLEEEQQLLKGEGNSSWWERFVFTRRRNKGEYDFSHEVKDSMDQCLACKACSTACPIKVDVPTFRARFLNYYHSRYNRPIKDYLVAGIEQSAPLMAKAPRLLNTITQLAPVKLLIEKGIGYVDTPQLSVPTLANRISDISKFDQVQFETLSEAEQRKAVFIVQDPFTSFYEAELVEAFVKLIKALGYTPYLLPFLPNGKPQHVKGFLKEFRATAKKAADFLESVSEYGVPLVGLDASLVMVYRDEYKQILNQKERGDFNVLLAHEWLAKVDATALKIPSTQEKSFTLLSHCTETTALPNTTKVWQQLFKTLGLELKTPATGCCGMAGTYGHEQQHQENSKQLYDMSWQPIIAKHQPNQILATGFSCRCQVKRFEGQKPKHPIQMLAELLN